MYSLKLPQSTQDRPPYCITAAAEYAFRLITQIPALRIWAKICSSTVHTSDKWWSSSWTTTQSSVWNLGKLDHFVRTDPLSRTVWKIVQITWVGYLSVQVEVDILCPSSDISRTFSSFRKCTFYNLPAPPWWCRFQLFETMCKKTSSNRWYQIRIHLLKAWSRWCKKTVWMIYLFKVVWVDLPEWFV